MWGYQRRENQTRRRRGESERSARGRGRRAGQCAEKSECGRMAEDEVKAADAGEEVKAKKRSFRKFSYRGVELTQLLDLKVDELQELLHSRARRRFVPPLVPRLSSTGAGGEGERCCLACIRGYPMLMLRTLCLFLSRENVITTGFCAA